MIIDVSRRAVRILNSTGCAYTNPKAALELIARGRARYVDEETIEIIAPAPRVISGDASSRPHSPSLAIVDLHGEHFDGQTFIPYPQPGSFETEA